MKTHNDGTKRYWFGEHGQMFSAEKYERQETLGSVKFAYWIERTSANSIETWTVRSERT